LLRVFEVDGSIEILKGAIAFLRSQHAQAVPIAPEASARFT
jgi:hypothetical protein